MAEETKLPQAREQALNQQKYIEQTAKDNANMEKALSSVSDEKAEKKAAKKAARKEYWNNVNENLKQSFSPKEEAPKEDIPTKNRNSFVTSPQKINSAELEQNYGATLDPTEKAYQEGEKAYNAIEGVKIPHHGLVSYGDIMSNPEFEGNRGKYLENAIFSSLGRALGGNVDKSYIQQRNDATEENYRNLLNQRDARAVDANLQDIEAVNKFNVGQEMSVSDAELQTALNDYKTMQTEETKARLLSAMLDNSKFLEGLSDTDRANLIAYQQIAGGNYTILDELLRRYSPNIINAIDKIVNPKGSGGTGDGSGGTGPTPDITGGLMPDPATREANGEFGFNVDDNYDFVTRGMNGKPLRETNGIRDLSSTKIGLLKDMETMTPETRATLEAKIKQKAEETKDNLADGYFYSSLAKAVEKENKRLDKVALETAKTAEKEAQKQVNSIMKDSSLSLGEKQAAINNLPESNYRTQALATIKIDEKRLPLDKKLEGLPSKYNRYGQPTGNQSQRLTYYADVIPSFVSDLREAGETEDTIKKIVNPYMSDLKEVVGWGAKNINMKKESDLKTAYETISKLYGSML